MYFNDMYCVTLEDEFGYPSVVYSDSWTEQEIHIFTVLGFKVVQVQQGEDFTFEFKQHYPEIMN